MAPEHQLAGFARLTLRRGRAWWWTALAGLRGPNAEPGLRGPNAEPGLRGPNAEPGLRGPNAEPGLPLVTVRDHDVDPPRGGGLEIRAPGLWAEPVCETPFDHWSLGLEAKAVALDDPTEAYAGERGDPVPLGLDLEWEASGRSLRWPDRHSYGQPCQVHGEVLVGRERLRISAFGSREHGWGPVDWWGRASSWAVGHLDDGTPFGRGLERRTFVDLDQHGLVAGGWLGPTARLHPVAHAPVQIPDGPDKRVSRLARAVCRVETEDRRAGWAWAERLQPASRTTGA